MRSGRGDPFTLSIPGRFEDGVAAASQKPNELVLPFGSCAAVEINSTSMHEGSDSN